jgi:3-phosphoshikimate 1-carboxyvinyltransferase
LFAGLLSKGSTLISNPLICNDTKATVNAISCLGAKVSYEPRSWSVESNAVLSTPDRNIECGESGVTLRFTIPIASLLGSEVRLNGSAVLMQRPLQPLIEAMEQLGVSVELDGFVATVKAGSAKGGSVQLPGNVSSQFISGLLLAAPLMEKGLHVEVTSLMESRGYVSLTIEAMRRHGVEVQSNRDMSSFQVAPDQTYHPAEHSIPGDYSSAAFLISAAILTGSKISVTGLSEREADPDSEFLRILARMGAVSEFSSNKLRLRVGELRGTRVDISNCPDLGPVMAVLGSHADGETEITGAERLRYKESDRLSAIATELKRLGADVSETGTGLLLSGPSKLHGGTVGSHGDHRIAMALAVAALDASENVTIRDAECVNKSYPTFFDDLRSVGVEVNER